MFIIEIINLSIGSPMEIDALFGVAAGIFVDDRWFTTNNNLQITNDELQTYQTFENMCKYSILKLK